MREWLAANPNPSGRVLAEAGYVAPHWPRPWGLDADPIHQLIIDDELSKAKVRRPANPIGIGWAGPTGFFVAGGFGGHGFQHSPATGRHVAEWLLDGRPAMDLSLFDPARFDRGRGR